VEDGLVDEVVEIKEGDRALSVEGKGSRLPLDQGGEVVHAMGAGGELRSHVLGFGDHETLLVVEGVGYPICSKGKVRVRQGSGCTQPMLGCWFAGAFPRWLEQRAGLEIDRRLSGGWNTIIKRRKRQYFVAIVAVDMSD